MKTKKQFTNRILSLALALVMVAGMMPRMATEAHAAEPITLEGDSFTTDPGQGFTFRAYYYCGVCKKRSYPNQPADTNHSIEITSFNYKISQGKISYTYGYKVKGCDGESTGSFSEDRTFDCSQNYIQSGWLITPPGLSTSHSVAVLFSRSKSAHQGDATCKTAANCTLCGTSYTNTNNHEKPNEFTYSVSTSDPAKHDVKYACCGATKETVAHTVAPTYTVNATDHTKHDKTYSCCEGVAETTGHSYTYAADSSVLTETCANGCGHQAVASIVAGEAIYTGSAITDVATISYDSGTWAGEEPVLNFENNVNVGTATAKMTAGGATASTTFKINPASISYATVTLDPESGTYNGNAFTPSVTVTFKGATLVKDTDYTLSWDKSGFTNAGAYTATVTGKGNYEGTKNAVFSILPADIKGAVVTLDKNTFVYDGLPHKPTAIVTFNGAMLTEGVDYELYYMSKDQIMTWENDEPVRFFGYESSDSINAGQYYAVVRGKGNFAANSHIAYAAYTITQAGNAWVTEPSISGWTYGETAKEPVGAAKFGDVSVEYSGTANDGTSYISTIAPTKAGNYTATFTVSETENYSGLETSVDFIIAKAYYNMTGAKWDYREPFQYNGKEHKVEVVGLPTGVTVGSYENNTAAAVGDYYAKANLAYDVNNYHAPAIGTLGWTIYNDWTPTEYDVNGSSWMNTDFVISARDGYRISLTEDGEWNESLTFSPETADGSVTFYLKDETSGAISLAKTVSYKIDKTAPSGKVEFVERTGWEEFVNTITFGLFYKDEVTVKITGADTLSGVAKIEHYESNEAKTLDEVMEIADWPEYNGSFGVALKDAKRFVYFVRITDNAGNVTYLSTDGAEYDTTAPAIEDIENGKTYYTTQKVTVTDKNLDTVTVNGTPVTGNVMLEGDKDATYTIAATDKAGNTTTVTVTMKPIKELAKAAEDLTHDNVTSADAPVLQELIAKLDELIADPDTSDDGERETLEQHKVIAESLLKTIEDAAKAADTENTEKVKDVTAENVTPENKADLENAKVDLEKALEDNMGNYTEEEKQEIAEEIRRIENAIEALENVERVTDAITQLPDTVEPDDEEAAEKILDAKKAYDELTDHEKSLVSEDVKKKLDDLVASLTAYDIIKGDGSAWTKDSGSTISFTANGPFSKFVGIQVDGVAVDKANYEAVSGSTVVTLKASYLDTLKVGEHTITIVYNDGSTDGTFKILAKPNTPATGDDFNIPLYSSLMAVSVIALVVLLLDARKRKYTK